VSDFDSLQIDLFSRYKIDKIIFGNEELKYRREANSVFVKFPSTQKRGINSKITVTYSGRPPAVKNPEWEGGFTWRKDIKGRDWVGVACESTGASIWWPCKDHVSDEPDSASMHFTVPSDLVCVSNGKLIDTTNHSNNTTTWNWKVTYPINIYNITLNLAHYSHFSDNYLSGNENLSLDYYVLDYNLPHAKLQFQQVKTMMACYEKYFGRYPFWRDGYKLVETPYWGMEHQSAISYGNEYINNKEGFDFIIIHESAHEWWGNNVSANDKAGLWLHESFATYSEALFVECTKSYDDAVEYLVSQRWQIRDSFAIIGTRGINYDAIKVDNDLYFKGAWMLHTFRSVLNNDSLFFKILKGLQSEFALRTISELDVINYANKVSEKDYSAFFHQYLNYTQPPVLEYKIKQRGKNALLTYRWKSDVLNFLMPVEVRSEYKNEFGKVTEKFIRLDATNDFKTVTIPNFDSKNFDVNESRFYVKMNKL
ncbi:MAG: M1 family metallopeptidase, partial [Chitinophagales bacterium]|nr:M1 family metallopeptidase [Chitinophagales bacterium]